ncbi:MAG: hypothetical protein FJ027_21460 [Candidatus Rokubacteria bacterium]|nr:hypothetical protein [Candidatus Rokubacteria bacterium]
MVGECAVAEDLPLLAARVLERFVQQYPQDARVGAAFLLLGKARLALGQPDAALGQGRVLTGEQRWQEARAALGPLLAGTDSALAAEAARWLGETFRGEGDHLAAAEYFMTAVYLSPDSATGRRALLAAAESFAAINQRASAAGLFRRVLAHTDLPAEIVDAARRGLGALGR